MSPPRLRSQQLKLSFPRVSGDEPEDLANTENTSLFSPRERG